MQPVRTRSAHQSNGLRKATAHHLPMYNLIEEGRHRRLKGQCHNMDRMGVLCSNSHIKVRNVADLCSQSIPVKLLHALHIWTISH